MKFNPSQNDDHFNVLFFEYSPGKYRLKADSDLLDSLKALPEAIDFDHVDEKYHSILFYASINGRINTVKYLLEERGVNPNQAVQEDLTAFHGAARNGHLDVMNILFSHGAKLSAVNVYGETALIKAIDYLEGERLDKVVDFIVSHSPESVSKPDEDGNLPISFALMKKAPSVIKKLLDAGSDVTKENYQEAVSMIRAHCQYQSANNARFFRTTPDQENVYQSAKLIVEAYNEKHLVEDLAKMKTSIGKKEKLGCEPPPGSTIDETGRTVVPSSSMRL